jgi:hypothetical protein
MRPRFIIIIIIISLLLGLGRFFNFLILYTVGRTPWKGDQPFARPLHTHRATQTQNKHTKTSMTWVGFEPTIPELERARFHAIDRAATVIDKSRFRPTVILPSLNTLEIDEYKINWWGSYKKEFFNIKRGSFPTTAVNAFHAEKNGFSQENGGYGL